jgi:hypothetical protein
LEVSGQALHLTGQTGLGGIRSICEEAPMLTVDVKALTSSDIQVSVIYDGSDGSDAPVFVTVNEFDSNANQLDTSGQASPIGGIYAVFHHLKPATTYFYQLVVTINTDTGLSNEAGPWNRYSGQTLAAIQHPSPPPQPTIWITSVQAFPTILSKQGQTEYVRQQNHFELGWEANVDVSEVNVEITSSAGIHGLNSGGGGSSGIIDNLSPPPTGTPKFGLLCTIRIRGQYQSNWTSFSQSVQVQDPDNPHAVREFMYSSGIDASNGIVNLFSQSPGSGTQLPVSFRTMMQI